MLTETCADWLDVVELDVRALVADWDGEEARARAAVDRALRARRSAVLYTSRELVQDDGAGGLAIGQRVTNALCAIVARLDAFPDFLIAKGGITSNDVAVEALGVRRATVLGQVVPGVPAWRCGAESKAPGLAYVVFPGNVGAPDDLARVARLMSGRDGAPAAGAPAAGAALHVGGGRVAIPEMLASARARGAAVGAFNVYNLEGALAVARAAERARAPAILQLHPASMSFGGTALIAACLDVAAAAGVPVGVQLDHAADDGAIDAAIAAGVGGVMADGSHLELADNTAWTARVVARARVAGVAVEAELGKLAGEEDGLSVPEKEAKMTDPGIVGAFLAATRVDALAVTIGNVHGKYARDPPELDWERLARVREAAGSTPLVLHGASGLPDAMLARAIAEGVAKFNVNTEVRAAARAATARASADGGDVLDVMGASVDAMVPVIAEKMRAFGW